MVRRKIVIAIAAAVAGLMATTSSFAFDFSHSSFRHSSWYGRYMAERRIPAKSPVTTTVREAIRTKKDIKDISSSTTSVSIQPANVEQKAGKLFSASFIPQVFGIGRGYSGSARPPAWYVNIPGITASVWRPVWWIQGNKLHTTPSKTITYNGLKITFKQYIHDGTYLSPPYKCVDERFPHHFPSVYTRHLFDIEINGKTVRRCYLKKTLIRVDTYYGSRHTKYCGIYSPLTLSCSSNVGAVIPSLTDPSVSYIYMEPTPTSAYLLQVSK